MSSGIVTIATGADRYYVMAKNLLHSIRIVSPKTKVAILTDVENPYIQEYDEYVVLDKANNSYLDKIDLLIKCPFDENIFIDADSLMYKSIDYLWTIFQNGSDFSFLGERLPLDSKEGYFELHNVERVIDYPVHYIPRLHGGLYYIRPGEYCRRMWDLCMKIKKDYVSFNFNIFKNPADEPILALAAAIMDSTVVESINDICFLPVAKKVYADFFKEKLEYIENNVNYSAAILHFSNRNTERALYKNEVDKVYYRENAKKFFISKYLRYYITDYFGTREKIKCTIYEFLPQRVKKLYQYIKRYLRKV